MKSLPLVILAALLLSVGTVFAQSLSSALPDRFVPEGKGITRLEKDLNGDGAVDDVLWFDGSGNKVKEELDTNSDGTMDTFYYYNERGVLSRVEVDTNFDGKIDLWVWLSEGVYIARYERDADYDGKADAVRVFGDAKTADGTTEEARAQSANGARAASPSPLPPPERP